MTEKKNAGILIAEDEKALLDFYRMELEKKYERVLTASSKEEALNVFQAEKEKRADISLVITDVEMETEMAGTELISEISKQDPATQFIIISNLHKRAFVALQTANANVGSLPKPAEMFHLKLAVSSALQRYSEAVWVNRLKKLINESPWLEHK